eukprot:31712-Prymnesium_polylepis.1
MSHTCSQTPTTRLTPKPRPRGLHPASHHSHAPGKRERLSSAERPPRLRATRTRQADQPRSHRRALQLANDPAR